MASSKLPDVAVAAVLCDSAPVPEDAIVTKGFDFENNPSADDLIASFRTSGFQATHLGMAIEEVNKMIEARREPVATDGGKKEEATTTTTRSDVPCTIWLSFTSNMISSGWLSSLCPLSHITRYPCCHHQDFEKRSSSLQKIR
eukprot:GHVU01140364.1.p3 GENE.GHVU01140364.1~~GHVU01140364.1.p3  ORF type:complete len:156 (+),score=16.54 GHVU01140364.1:42-470(+)